MARHSVAMQSARESASIRRMKALLALVLSLAPMTAAAVTAAPTPAQLRQALTELRRAPVGPINGLACQASRSGYVRCTYRETIPGGYERMAVLVSSHGGRWSVSEGPIPEKPAAIRRLRTKTPAG